jgi:hypothetical protein
MTAKQAQQPPAKIPANPQGRGPDMSSIKLFETHQVRSQWDSEKEAWFFSIVDVVGFCGELV